MVETTQTSEALSSALGGDGLMQSEYYKLVFNEETGQWEKQKVTEDIDPVFPGIRDVTPDYSPEGKTFKTIPIGAGPDYAPVVPDVPTLPITQPVEPVVPEEPEVVQPVVTQPDQGPSPDPMDIPTFVNKEKTTVTVGENTFPSTIINPLPNYREKYESLPGGFNNWSDSQVLQYAIDTGALNSMLSQDNNPYYIAPQAEKTGLMAEAGSALQNTTIGVVAKGLDMFFGTRERKALVKRMIDAGMLSGESSNYLDDKGNFKSENANELLKNFKDNNAPQNGLVSSSIEPTVVTTQRPYDDPYITRESTRVPTLRELRIPDNVLTLEQVIGRDPEDTNSPFRKGSFLDKIRDKFPFKLDFTPSTQLSVDETRLYNGWMRENSGKYDPNTGKILPEYADKVKKEGSPVTFTEIFDPQIKAFTTDPLIFAEAERRRISKSKLTDTIDTTPVPSFIETLQQFSVEGNKIVPGISQSQPVMGTSGSHVNGEAVYVNSEAGHYTSDGKYHADTNGDGITDKVQAGGSAGNAQETANSGFIPEATLSRMTNPDGSLKNLYTPQGGPTGSYGLNSDVMELRDGKYYYTGNVVQENRDVVDNGGNGNTIDNAAPDNSNDNQSYERDKEMEKAKENPKDDNYTQANYEEASGTGSGSSDTSSKDKPAKIVCTEMYRQTQLDDWQRTIKLWYLFQKKYLSETHQKGYHFLFKPFVKGMQKSNMLTSVGRHFAQERTKDIKHIMYGTKFSLLGRVYRIILEPICFLVGLLLWQNK